METENSQAYQQDMEEQVAVEKESEDDVYVPVVGERQVRCRVDFSTTFTHKGKTEPKQYNIRSCRFHVPADADDEQAFEAIRKQVEFQFANVTEVRISEYEECI